jgi:hypothetical protein
MKAILAWILENWPLLSVAVISELMAFLPVKYKGILQAIINLIKGLGSNNN